MPSELPDPLVPAHVDLTGFGWMPLYGDRLLASTFDSIADDTAFRAAVNLWWHAWKEIPAGSLPNNDKALAKFAGFGKDVRAFSKCKKIAMHGFILCKDDRYHHRKMAIWVMEAWETRVESRAKKDADLDRQHRHREERHKLFIELHALGEFPAWNTDVTSLRAMLEKAQKSPRLPLQPVTTPVTPVTLQERDSHSDEDVTRHGTGHTLSPAKTRHGPRPRPRSIAYSDVVGNAQTEPVDKSGNGAIKENAEEPKHDTSKGQEWDNPLWVNATAEMLHRAGVQGMKARSNEVFREFKDRVYVALATHIRTTGRAK